MVSGPAPAVIYTLSLHDALPIWAGRAAVGDGRHRQHEDAAVRHRRELPGELDRLGTGLPRVERSEEHTSELQSLTNLVCRLLLEKKNKNRLNSGPQPETHPLSEL